MAKLNTLYMSGAKNKLIASSPTKEGLTKMVNQYFYGTGLQLLDNGDILNSSGTGHLKSFKWELKRKRYRLISL